MEGGEVGVEAVEGRRGRFTEGVGRRGGEMGRKEEN